MTHRKSFKENQQYFPGFLTHYNVLDKNENPQDLCSKLNSSYSKIKFTIKEKTIENYYFLV